MWDAKFLLDGMGAQEAEKNYNVPVVVSSFEQVNEGEEMTFTGELEMPCGYFKMESSNFLSMSSCKIS